MFSTRLRMLLGVALLVGGCHRAPDPSAGGVRLEYGLDADTEALPQTLDIVKRRLEALRVNATVTVVGKHIVVDLPAATPDTTAAVRNELTTGKLEIREVDDGPAPAELPPGTLEVMATMFDGSQKLVRLKPGGVGPGNIVDAEVLQDDNGVAVNVRFNAAGKALLDKLTRDSINRPMAIVLDGKVLSMPIVRTPITGGQARITMATGDSEKQLADAETLVRALRAGALPGRLVFESINVVPPQKK